MSKRKSSESFSENKKRRERELSSPPYTKEGSPGKAMNLWLILTGILNHVPVEQLLRLRCVSDYWNESISFVIRQRKLWSTNLQTISTQSNQTFFECFADSKDFPCTYLDFPLRVDTPELEQEFYDQESKVRSDEDNNDNSGTFNKLFQVLRKHGHKIKILSMNIVYRGNLGTICKILLREMPNLERLRIRGEYVGPSSVLLTEEQTEFNLALPRLKALAYGSNDLHSRKCLLYTILKGAPCIKEITGFEIDDTNVLVKTGKQQAVTDLWLKLRLNESDALTRVELLYRLAKLTPATRLVRFVLFEKGIYPGKARWAISQILQSSAESLNLMYVPSSHFMRGITFPATFPNLEILRLFNEKFYDSSYESNAVSFTQFSNSYFPKVTDLTLFMYDMRLDSLTRTLQDYDYVSYLRDLESGFEREMTREVYSFPVLETLKLKLENVATCNEVEVRMYLKVKFPEVTRVIFQQYKRPSLRMMTKTEHCFPHWDIKYS